MQAKKIIRNLKKTIHRQSDEPDTGEYFDSDGQERLLSEPLLPEALAGASTTERNNDNDNDVESGGGPSIGMALWHKAALKAKAAAALTPPQLPSRRSDTGSTRRDGSSALDKWIVLLGSVHEHRHKKRAPTTPASPGADEEGIAPCGCPESEVAPTYGFRRDVKFIWRMLSSSYLNLLLLAMPIGILGGILRAPPLLVFSSNFLALLPLALILGEITEDLAVRFGDAIGGLLNATFGNVVEMILGLAALSQGLYSVVAASLLGSILSNLLLVLGCCFLFGGIKHKIQLFNALANKVSSSLLFLASIAIIIPTSAKTVYGEAAITPTVLRNLSHAIAIALIILYGCYLYFQLATHSNSLNGESTENQSSHNSLHANNQSQNHEQNREEAPLQQDGEEERSYPCLSLAGALISLTLITVTVAACSEFLTGAIEAVSKLSGINQTFIGLIVLPIAGNAAEHITAVFVALKNKMDLAISVALGSSIQIAIFVLPVTVLAGWAMGKEFTLDLDPFAVLMLTVSVILAYFVTSDGSSNWMLGLQLVVTYVLIGAVYLLANVGEGQKSLETSAALVL